MSQGGVREPNFFLVGASRAGTTSLWRYLVQHPDVFMPDGAGAVKEPSHFCEQTPRWAAAFRDRGRYLGLFAAANGATAIGEASTPYLVAPEVPARIRAAYPDARIIIVLRNPADRAYSLYRFLCGIGAEWASTFEKALALEDRRMADDSFGRENRSWYGLYQYFHSGLYSTQVERYLATFPRRQVHILLYDDLQTGALEATRRIYRFLGVGDRFTPTVNRYNSSDEFPWSVRLQYLLAHGLDRGDAEADMGPLRRRALTHNLKLGRLLKRRVNPATRRRLLDAYRDDIRRTSEMIDRSLDGWVESR